MRLSFVPDGMSDGPVLVLSRFTGTQVCVLQTAVRDLSAGRRTSASVPVDSDEGLSLEFVVVHRDLGVGRQGGVFTCALSAASWDTVDGLLDPFVTGGDGFQWLTDAGPIALLLSESGRW